MSVALQSGLLIANRYCLLAKIGQGGMGAVYRAQDRLRSIQVALKRVELPYDPSKLSLPNKVSKTASDSKLASQLALVNEFRLLAALRHPNIVSVLDYGLESDGTPFFTMELIEDSQPFIKAITGYTVLDKVKSLVQLLQALVYLHRHDIVHHDLKPNNVLIDSAGQVRVVDFGLALHAHDHTDHAGTLYCTAPEIIDGGIATVATDLYSFGVLCYEALLGERPFLLKKSISQLRKDVLNKSVDFNRLRDLVGLPLTELIANLLARDPRQRPADASFVMREMCAAVGLPTPPETLAIRNSFLQTAQFVGRTQELTRLEQSLDEALEGRGAMWFVAGESGVGKSRLMEELRIRALVKGVRVLHGKFPENSNVNFEMWRAPMEALLLTTPITPLQASLLKALVPNIDDLIEAPVEDFLTLSPLAQQDRVMTTIVELFACQTEPILLLLDDLQFAHADLELLHLLTKAVNVLPLMIVASYRHDETPQLADQFSGTQVIKLPRLAPDEIVQLSTAILGEAANHKSLQALLYRETEGNTFFLIEVLRMLAEDVGQLANIGNRALPDQVFPVSVSNITERRLARLSSLDQHVLKFAAVYGRVINFLVIAHCYPDHQLIYWVTHCADAGILTIVEGRPEFAHDKLRAFIISSIEPDLLASFHLQIAEAIEELYPQDDSYTPILAYHLQNAGEFERAIPYQLLEADRLISLGEMTRARTLLMKLLIDVERQEIPQPDERMMRWYYLLGRTLEFGIMMVGSSEEAIGWLERSLVLSMKLNDQPLIADTLTRMALISLEHYGGTEAAEVMLSSAEDIYLLFNNSRGLAAVAFVRANAYYLAAKYPDSVKLYQQALRLFEQVGDQAQIAFTRERYGVVLTQMGDYARGKQQMELALKIAREIGDRVRVVFILSALVYNTMLSQNMEVARQYMDECYPLAVATEQYRIMASVLTNRAELYAYYQNYEPAVDALIQSIAISENIGNRRGATWANAKLAECELALGRLTNARETLSHWLSLAIGLERLSLRVGVIPTIQLAILEHHYFLATEWLGMMHAICVNEREMNEALRPLQEAVQAKIGLTAFQKSFAQGMTLVIEQEVPRLRMYIEQRYPANHP